MYHCHECYAIEGQVDSNRAFTCDPSFDCVPSTNTQSLRSGRRYLYEQADCGAEWHSALPTRDFLKQELRRWPILFFNAILRLRSSLCSSLRSGRRAVGFLKQEPRRGPFFFVEAVRAREQGKAAGVDQTQVGRGQPGSGKKRIGFEESVHQPVSARGEQPVEFRQVGGFVAQAVETTDVERQVEGTGDAVESGDIAHAQIRIHARLLHFSFCDSNRFGDEVHARHPPAVLGEGDDVGACAATEVNRAAGMAMMTS